MADGNVRLGLGCMRLRGSAGADVVAAAIDAGYTHFDTARAYGTGPTDAGESERALAAGLAKRPARRDALVVVTKVGMVREGTAWLADGRARTIRAQTEASVAILGPVDLLLDHAPSRRTARSVTVRALLAERERGSARAIGLSNPTLPELEQACGIAELAAIEVELGAFADAATRGGLVAFAARRGIVVLAHSPFGGPKRARRLKSNAALAGVAARRGASAHAVWLAYLAAVGEAHGAAIVPLVGASTIASVEDAATARSVELGAEDLDALDAAFPGLRRRRSAAPVAHGDREIVLVMGIPGAGKSTWVEPLVARGYERLNRDLRGGTLRELAKHLDERLLAEASPTKFVLDNTYLVRAQRADVLDVAAKHGVPVRCVHVAPPLAVAQARICERMLERFGAVLDADAIAKVRDPAAVLPLVAGRSLRALEPPAPEEGFAAIETVVPPVLARGRTASGIAVALDASAEPALAELRADAWTLFGWAADLSPEVVQARAAALAARVGASVEVRTCRHPGGPPRCHCRPPFPGLVVAFAHERGIDPAKLLVVGYTNARTIATGVGATFLAATTTDGAREVR